MEETVQKTITAIQSANAPVKKKITSKKQRGSMKNANVHLQRYIRHKAGKTTQEIADEDGVKVQTVNDSIVRVDAYRATHTVEYLNESMIAVVMDADKHIRSAITGGLQAMTKDDRGRPKPDHQTRGKILETVAKIVQTVQPRPAGGINLKVNQQSVMAGQPASPPPEAGFVGYEERLRIIRRKIDQHNLLPSEVGTVRDDDAEIEEDESPEGSPEVVTIDAGNSDTKG